MCRDDDDDDDADGYDDHDDVDGYDDRDDDRSTDAAGHRWSPIDTVSFFFLHVA